MAIHYVLCMLFHILDLHFFMRAVIQDVARPSSKALEFHIRQTVISVTIYRHPNYINTEASRCCYETYLRVLLEPSLSSLGSTGEDLLLTRQAMHYLTFELDFPICRRDTRVLHHASSLSVSAAPI